MYFLFMFLVVAMAGSLITVRVLAAYSSFRLIWKILIAGVVIAGWCAPALVGAARRGQWLTPGAFAVFSDVLYALFGFVFILLCLLLLRDFIWFAAYRIARWMGNASPLLDPMNVYVLDRANLAVVALALGLSGWALYEGNKTPRLVELTYASDKISAPADIVLINDFHVNRTTSLSRINRLVARVKGLRPDVVVIAGDLVDDRASAMEPQIEALSKLRGTYGTYLALGNHEFYSGINSWLNVFKNIGYKVLYNYGEYLPGFNLYIAGVPDSRTTAIGPYTLRPNLYDAMSGSKDGQYKLLLSHSPDYAAGLYNRAVDLILSGHTHGGQIFPFHLLVKKVNKFLSGEYDVRGMKLYVSNGYGYWGPSIRLFAPSELTLIHLVPAPAEKTEQKK